MHGQFSAALRGTALVVCSGVMLVAFPRAAVANSELLEELARNPVEKRVYYSRDDVEQIEPLWPNPYLSFLPAEADPDFDYWRARMKFAAEDVILQSLGAVTAALITTNETEPNDTQADANFIVGFGTGDGQDREADLQGSLGAVAPLPIGPFAEDDGSIPLASETGLGGGTVVVEASGSIGDGPFGSAGTGTGDFDFFRIPGVAAGETIEVDVDTPSSSLDSFVVLYDSAGNVVDFNDDDGGSLDSFLRVVAPLAGDYYLSIGGFGSFALSDPFDSSSGTGAASEGGYDVRIGFSIGDTDYFSFDLEPGDLFGASLLASGMNITLVDPSGTVRVGSAQDVTFVHPAASPLPSGNVALSYVIETGGTWAIRVGGTSPGPYSLRLRVFTNPLLEAEAGEVQTVFLDFDGATVNTAIFGRPPSLRSLSPLSSFLGRWGLGAADEGAVIGAIIDAFEESFATDVGLLGNNGDFDTDGVPGHFDTEILNSRDHPEPGAAGDVTRIVIGGTIPELGIGTIGIAESIDTGNFETQETGVVLLDLLSAPAGDPNSLNSFPLDPTASMIDFVGIGVGNIAAHEAGHLIGNFHTNQFNPAANVMDQGGNLTNTVGVGADGVFGSADDVDVDFGTDVYVPNEGFLGEEDTLNFLAFGMPTSASASLVAIDIRPGTPWNTFNLNSNGMLPVALLGSDSFDVRDVDVTTLAFGPAAAATWHRNGHFEEANGDEHEDLLLHFRIPETGIGYGDSEACLTGETLSGLAFEGCDGVVVLEPGTRCEAATTALLGAGVSLEIGPNNGDFETGDFTGWSQLNGGSGGIAIDDGSLDPPGPGRPVPPFQGSYGAATFQGGPGIHTLYTDVVLDSILSSAQVSWADHLENHSGVFADGVQEWRVEVWDPSSNAVLAELYSTEPGDPAFQGWTVRQADLAPWIGQTIRLAFTQQDSLFYFNARLDAVAVTGVGVFDVEIDIKPGSKVNRVNLAANGVIPVAILGSDEFDVHDIDPTTLAFGPEAAPAAHRNLCNQEGFGSHVRDVNEDGFDDLVTHYRTQQTGIAIGAVEACLEGRLVTGQSFEGCDSISVLACGLGFELVLVVPLLAWARRRLRN